MKDDRRRRRTCADGDGHVDARPAGVAVVGVAVVGLDRDGVGVLRGSVERGPRAHRDLAAVGVDLERGRAGEAVGERVPLDVGGRHGRAHVVALGGALGYGERHRGGREHRIVVHSGDVHGDGGGGRQRGAAGVPHLVDEVVRAVVVGSRRVREGRPIVRVRGGVHHDRPLARHLRHAQRQLAAVVLGVAVVGQHVDRDRRVFQGGRRVVGGCRRFVHIGQADGDADGVGTAEAVVDRHRQDVAGRARIEVERRARGNLDLPGGAADHELGRAADRVGQRVALAVAGQHRAAGVAARPGVLGYGDVADRGRQLRGRVREPLVHGDEFRGGIPCLAHRAVAILVRDARAQVVAAVVRHHGVDV